MLTETDEHKSLSVKEMLYCAHFSDEETELFQVELICSRSYGLELVRLEFRLRSLAPTVDSQLPVHLARPSGERTPSTPQDGGGRRPGGEAREGCLRSGLGFDSQGQAPEK